AMTTRAGRGARRGGRRGSDRFMLPMHDRKGEEALHEPGTCLRLGRRFLTLNPDLNLNRRTESKSKIMSKSKTDSRFMVPMHAGKRKEGSERSEDSTAGKMPAAP